MAKLIDNINRILEEEFFWNPEVNDVNIRLERMFKQYIEELIGEDEAGHGEDEWYKGFNFQKHDMRDKLKNDLG